MLSPSNIVMQFLGFVVGHLCYNTPEAAHAIQCIAILIVFQLKCVKHSLLRSTWAGNRNCTLCFPLYREYKIMPLKRAKDLFSGLFLFPKIFSFSVWLCAIYFIFTCTFFRSVAGYGDRVKVSTHIKPYTANLLQAPFWFLFKLLTRAAILWCSCLNDWWPLNGSFLTVYMSF